MNVRRAEQAVQIMSIVAIWAAVCTGWSLAGQHTVAWQAQGIALPALTRAWLGLAGTAAIFVLPFMATVLVAVLMQRRSVHANWVAGLVLVVSLLLVTVAQAAVALPMAGACACVK